MPDFLDSQNTGFDSELIIGLVCAVGAETTLVIDVLKERLGRAGYRAIVIKVSAEIIPLIRDVPDTGNDPYNRINALMDAGNLARQKGLDNGVKGDDSVLALNSFA